MPNRWITACVVLGCALFLYLETFVLPNTPRAATGDQSIYLFDAARMLDGQVIYRDLDHFTLPGTSALYLVLFKIFGVKAWIPQAMLVLVGTLTAWLSMEISAKLVQGISAYLPGLLFLTMPFSSYLDATHHWYSTAAATGALTVLMERRTSLRLACAGVLWGVATCFTQSLVLGPIGLAVYLMWEGKRCQEPRIVVLWKEGALWSGYAATVLGFNAYFVWRAGFQAFVYNTVVFATKYYSQDDFNTWRAYMNWRPAIHGWTNWPEWPAWGLVHLLLPLAYILLFVRYGREAQRQREVAWERLMLVNTAGLSMLLSVASAPAFNRLFAVSLPALILLVWFLDSPGKAERVLWHALWATVIVLAVIKPLVTQTQWKGSLNLPTGQTVFFSAPSYDKTKWLRERTRPSDYFFGDQFEGFALRLRNPARIDFVRPTDYTRPEQVADLVGGLEEHQVRFVSWYAGLDNESRGSAGDHLAALREELRERYRVAARFANDDTIWERRF